jgi:release factor glutamine methyltransferase
MSKISEALEGAVDAMRAVGVEDPRLDAEVLLAAATGTDRAALVADSGAEVPAAAARLFGEMVRRRLRREPVAYIVGHRGFRHLDLAVDRRVLIPRPETELLVEVALERRPASVLDLGTGSGAIALAVADELPETRVLAIDTSMDALRVAQANSDRLGLTDRVDVVSRGIDSLASADPGDEGFDLLVANLPYVSEAEWEGLAPEIREYEPREALVSGPTGLEAITGLLEAVRSLARRPAVALEIGADQAAAVSRLVVAAGYADVETRRDLAGHDRVVVGR